MRKYLVLLSVLLLAAASGQELLVNGDFEAPLTTGWTQTQGGSGTHTVNRDTVYHPDPDFEAYVYQYDNPGWTRLSQSAEVPGPAVSLSFSVKLQHSTQTSCWPAAYFSIRYLDARDNLLGETRYYHSSVAPWSPSSTFHPVAVANQDWNDYAIEIPIELSQHLPGVNPGSVTAIEVALMDTTAGG